MAQRYNHDVRQIDIKSAFLHLKIPNDVKLHVKLPKEHTLAGRVFRLLKAMYGIREAPRLWADAYRKFLIEKVGLQQSLGDACLYHSQEADPKDRLYISFHVDDVLITGPPEKLRVFEELLMNEYEIRYSKPVDHFPGISVEKMSNGGYKLHQEILVDRMLDTYNDSIGIGFQFHWNALNYLTDSPLY